MINTSRVGAHGPDASFSRLPSGNCVRSAVGRFDLHFTLDDGCAPFFSLSLSFSFFSLFHIITGRDSLVSSRGFSPDYFPF